MTVCFSSPYNLLCVCFSQVATTTTLDLQDHLFSIIRVQVGSSPQNGDNHLSLL